MSQTKNLLRQAIKFKIIFRWFVTLINQPQFKAVLGEVTLCTKMAQFDSKKYNEIHGKGSSREMVVELPLELT